MSGKTKLSQAERKHRQQKIKEAVTMINDVVKVKIAPSDIHGVGVFTLRDIKKGEKMYLTAVPQFLDVPYKEFKNLRPEVSELILEHFPNVKTDNSHFMAPDTLMQMFLNHSDKPNYDNQTDKALRKIKVGEEVTEDYKNIKDWGKVFSWLK